MATRRAPCRERRHPCLHLGPKGRRVQRGSPACDTNQLGTSKHTSWPTVRLRCVHYLFGAEGQHPDSCRHTPAREPALAGGIWALDAISQHNVKKRGNAVRNPTLTALWGSPGLCGESVSADAETRLHFRV